MRQSLLRTLRRSALRHSAAHEHSLLPPQPHALRSQQQRYQSTRRQLHSTAQGLRPAAPAANASQQQNDSTATALALRKLDEYIAQRQHVQALTIFQQLREPPSTLALQKLAILLAKQKDAVLVARAYEILQSVYRLTGLVPDDYTTLASIRVVDACLRVRLLDEAVETYEEAFNRGVFLDLPAYDALLQALVRADRTLEAVAILNEIADEDDVAPSEHSYLPMLMALVSEGEYENASDLLEKGQARGVLFTGETFHPLVERVSQIQEPTDALVMLLTYIEDIWEDAKLFDEFADLGDDDIDEDDEDSDNGDTSSSSDEPRK